MINEQTYFQSLVFPWLIIDKEQNILAFSDGSLFPFPPEMDFEESVTENAFASEGWSCCSNGFARYSVKIPNANKWLICFGLKVKGVSTKMGTSSVLSIKSESNKIEKFVQHTLDSHSATEDQLKNIMRSSIHEVRSINTDIYHSSFEGCDSPNVQHKNKALKDVLALSELLKSRIDLLDAISNPVMLAIRGGKSDIYRMFDKIIRSLDATGHKKNVRIKISGSTIGRVEGIRLFSAIPYLLLQNALKYAPKHTEISVNLMEDPDTIYVKTSSWGPIVEKDEFSKIFRSGYRGKHAIEVEKDGTGIGLYFLKQLVEYHEDGSVNFFQDPHRKIFDGNIFAQTHFNLRFKRAS